MTNTFPHGAPGAPPSTFSNNPAAGSSLLPRRSSYASVVSGAASITPQHSRSAGSGALSHLINQSMISTALSQSPHRILHGRASSRTMDVDLHFEDGISNSSAMWGGRLPPSSSQFAALGYGQGLFGDSRGPGDMTSEPAFTPSYLRKSKYMERLAAANRARQAAVARKSIQATQSPANPGSLSTSSSSLNLHKMAPSHRGIAYDVVEKEPQMEDDRMIQLPSRWNETDKNPGIELLGDGLEARFVGPNKSHDNDSAAVRADHPMSPACGIYYYEITVLSKGKEGLIGFGFSGYQVSLNRLPGWESESWAYHGDDGNFFCCQDQGKTYGPKFSTRDIVGCGLNFRTGSCFFTKNGRFLGTAFRGIKGLFFPSVGMKRPGEHIRANFGQSPFVFDIDGLVTNEKMIIMMEINKTPSANLSPPLDETAMVQAIVSQFFAHEGHIETARAFAKEVQDDKQAFAKHGAATVTVDVEGEKDAVNRQRSLSPMTCYFSEGHANVGISTDIRKAILNGDIDEALRHTSKCYPSVLKNNGQIYFRMRCRKFIEMIRQCSELNRVSRSSDIKNGKAAKHAAADSYEEVFEHEMDLDEEPQDQTDAYETMETDESGSGLKHMTMLQETIKYGQLLQSEFRDDDRKEVKKALEETFSLLAYEDPKSSVVAHLLDPDGRVPVAEELNSAILQSLGKSSFVALERIYQQTEALLEELSDEGGAGALINVRHDLLS